MYKADQKFNRYKYIYLILVLMFYIKNSILQQLEKQGINLKVGFELEKDKKCIAQIETL